MPNGYPIVLTADRTLIADYPTLFDGMLTASQTTITPRPLMESLLMPKAISVNGRARVAPLGLRRVEAALLNGGFSPDDVALVTPETIAHTIGPATRIIGVASGEPCGLGMNTTTMTAVMGGQIYPQASFHHLLRRINRLRTAETKLVVGGPGTWQLSSQQTRRALGIDHLVTGYCEGNIAQIYRAIFNGETVPEAIAGEDIPADRIPPIHHATTMGILEISRGCGLGCEFCTIGGVPMRHLPEETILADARTNLDNGNASLAALSEDFFRYGANGVKVNPSALIALLHKLRQLPGLRLIQIDHANVTSIAQYADADLAAVRDALVGDAQHDYPWVNVGVETGSGRLLKANGGAAKMGRCAPDEWGDLCAEQLRRLCGAGFFPLVSLVIGLPGETEEDVLRTFALVNALKEERLAIFPVFHAPLNGTEGIRTQDLTRLQWQMFKTCYAQNFRWIPRMYWDNQTGAGVPLAKRLLLQSMGRGQVLLWNALFAWHTARARE